MVRKPASRLTVTVESPSGRKVVSIPATAPVDELLPGLIRACEGSDDTAGWTLAPQGEPALDGARTLAEAGVFTGAVVRLTRPAEPQEPAAAPATARRMAAAAAPSIGSMGGWDYLRTLERAIASSSAGGVIAVAGAQPGAGATTVAVLLSTLIAAIRHETVVAVDANSQSGVLSQWMAPDSLVPAAEYRSLLDPGVGPHDVESALVTTQPGLWVLPAPVDTTSVDGDATSWRRVIEHLRRLRHVVVIDCGAAMQREVVKAAVEAADHIVLVSKPDAVAKVPAQWRKPLVMVTNPSPRRARLQRRNGVATVTIPTDQQSAALLKRRGFAWRDAPASWQEAVRELIAVLAVPPPNPTY